MDKQYYIYMMSNIKNGTIYTGFTSDLIKRVWQHKNKVADGFTCKYDLDRLVYFEVFDNVEFAIKREKRLKNYLRDWKIDLIETDNPLWVDLYPQITGSFGQAKG